MQSTVFFRRRQEIFRAEFAGVVAAREYLNAFLQLIFSLKEKGALEGVFSLSPDYLRLGSRVWQVVSRTVNRGEQP